VYGEGNWIFGWVFGEEQLNFVGGCKVYEQAYYEYFWYWPLLLDYVCRNASNVYDDAESNVNSGLDYTIRRRVALTFRTSPSVTALSFSVRSSSDRN
jgi:hypothetical protein